MPDFMILAGIAGILTSLMAGPLGCFVVWRRMAYLGDSLSHSALLGVVLALMLQLPLFPSLLAVCLLVAFTLVLINHNSALEHDAILGILSHSALALGLLLWSFTDANQINLEAFLFGDLLSTQHSDIFLMLCCAIIVVAVISFYWKDFLLMTLNQELAQVEGTPVKKREYLLMLLMALVVAIAIKVVGVLLITALLIIPASAARFFAKHPKQMASMASLIGVISVVGGLTLSWFVDTPPGPGIVVVAFLIFVLAFLSQNKTLTAE